MGLAFRARPARDPGPDRLVEQSAAPGDPGCLPYPAEGETAVCSDNSVSPRDMAVEVLRLIVGSFPVAAVTGFDSLIIYQMTGPGSPRLAA